MTYVCGESGVGKTTLINTIIGNLEHEVTELSKRFENIEYVNMYGYSINRDSIIVSLENSVNEILSDDSNAK